MMKIISKRLLILEPQNNPKRTSKIEENTRKNAHKVQLFIAIYFS